MRTVRATAPGKALLSGEYVVLGGAPALSVALNRRATVTVSEIAGRSCEVRAPGFVDGSWYFDIAQAGGLHWHDASARRIFNLFEIVWRRCSLSASRALRISIDSRAFSDPETGAKLGLGSSAAVAVALTAALSRFGDARVEVACLARDAHQEFQHGHGSGVDIATSVCGGVTRFKLTSPPGPESAGWPEGLGYRFFWSGCPVATTAQLQKFLPALEGMPQRSAYRALAELATAIAASWSHDSAGNILDLFDAYAAALKRFSDELDLGIFAAGHLDMAGLASACGIVYKPCGAGGGDVGIALSLDEARLQDFCNKAGQAGFRQLNVMPDWQGVVVEKESRD
jgi:phosphomevalonate kinase